MIMDASDQLCTLCLRPPIKIFPLLVAKPDPVIVILVPMVPSFGTIDDGTQYRSIRTAPVALLYPIAQPSVVEVKCSPTKATNYCSQPVELLMSRTHSGSGARPLC